MPRLLEIGYTTTEEQFRWAKSTNLVQLRAGTRDTRAFVDGVSPRDIRMAEGIERPLMIIRV